jgi:hypothetical protein
MCSVSSFVFFSFFVFFIFDELKKCGNHQYLVTASNNITNNQPVPSVCVRVPQSHSPSLGSGSSPGSPVEKIQHHDFATLVVRESSSRKTIELKFSINFFIFQSSKKFYIFNSPFEII